jgi:hypothetical protein
MGQRILGTIESIEPPTPERLMGRARQFWEKQYIGAVASGLSVDDAKDRANDSLRLARRLIKSEGRSEVD